MLLCLASSALSPAHFVDRQLCRHRAASWAPALSVLMVSAATKCKHEGRTQTSCTLQFRGFVRGHCRCRHLCFLHTMFESRKRKLLQAVHGLVYWTVCGSELQALAGKPGLTPKLFLMLRRHVHPGRSPTQSTLNNLQLITYFVGKLGKITLQ